MKIINPPEAVSRENPEERQIPLNPGAGYLHAIEGEKPSRSGDRMARCLSMTDLTPSERMVLARIAHYDGPGGAFPSHERIGAEIGRKRRQVVNILQSIRRKGRVRWKRMRAPRAPNRYEIAYAEPFKCAILERSYVQSDCTRTGREEPEVWLRRSAARATRRTLDIGPTVDQE